MAKSQMENMSFEVKMKKPGDLIRSEDWNEAMNEIERLNKSKLSVDGGGISGPLFIDNAKSSKKAPLHFERDENKAVISIGNKKVLNIAENGSLGVGIEDPQAPLHVVGDLLGAARDQDGNSLKVRCGQTLPGSTQWEKNGDHGIYVDVDTSKCNFSSTPVYLANLHGEGNNWQATGGSSAYSRSPTSFRIYARFSAGGAISPADANSWKWHIQWIAVGN